MVPIYKLRVYKWKVISLVKIGSSKGKNVGIFIYVNDSISFIIGTLLVIFYSGRSLTNTTRTLGMRVITFCGLDLKP